MALQLPTYTSLWRLERRLYAIDDLSLGKGVPYDKLGIYAGIILPWWILLNRLGIRFEKGVPSILYLVVPAVATYFATRDVAQGKRPLIWAWSLVRYLLEPRAWHRLTPAGRSMPHRIDVAASCWQATDRPPRPRRAIPPPSAVPTQATPRALPPGTSGAAASPHPPALAPRQSEPQARDLVPAGARLPSILEQQDLRRAGVAARRRRLLSLLLTLGLVEFPDHRRGPGRHARRRRQHLRRPAQ